MTTSYIREAQKKLKAEKKILREQEAIEQKAKLEAEEKAHQANMARIQKKMDRIEKGLPVEEIIEGMSKKPVKKTTTKKTPKKPAAKKRGRPKKS